MEVTQILASVLIGLLGLYLSIRSEQKRNIRFWATISVIFISICSLTTQIVISRVNAKQKERDNQEFLKLKYANILDDNSIINEISNIKPEDYLGTVHLSPTKKTFGTRGKIRWIKIPCPSNQTFKYKIVDPAIYEFQSITPLMPVTSLNDGQKYFVGPVAVSDLDYNKDNKVVVVTKHKNGLLEVENIRIEDYILDIQSFRYNALKE